MGIIAQQDEDLDTLLGVIDTLMAANDFISDCDPSKTDGEGDPDDPENVDEGEDPENQGEDDPENTDEGEDPENQDEEDLENVDEGEDPENTDEDEDPQNQDEGEEDDPEALIPPAVNADSRSAVSEHLKVCRIGDKLHLDGLDRMSLLAAKKAVIKKVRPGIRLDGKSKSYINAAYDMVVQEVKSRKSTDYQRQQMIGGGKRTRTDSRDGGADAARQRMMARNINRNGGNK